LPSGLVGPPVRWAATSNVEVGQPTYPVNRGRIRREGRGGSEDKVTKRTAKVTVDGEPLGGLCLDISAGVPEFLVTPLLTGPV